MLPMPDALVVLEINGKQLKEVMEVSVSQYPKTEGRFLQVLCRLLASFIAVALLFAADRFYFLFFWFIVLDCRLPFRF